ncbi:MAG: coenzyme F420-0:L-glutamate ligase [Acidobacteria bacterium]|nr:coenzyme F420-0:L-glutamate ligase [Acidobacteriota bacterium]MCW5971569.1 coenzyme F420-0:L-glutamate ligase [Blastocatellales bacterium]
MTSDIQLLAVRGLPEVKPGDDLGALIVSASASIGLTFIDGDILIVAQKIVSKSEGRLLDLATVAPSQQAVSIGERQQRDPRLIEIILRESKSIIRRDAHVLITETHHGFICANAGVDRSNVDGVDCVALLPVDPDASARALQNRLRELLGVSLPVIVTDTFGRAWREGLTNAAIGVAGLEPLLDFRGLPDDHGRELSATVLAVADELAAASGLLMRKTERIPVVVVRGYDFARGDGSAGVLIRPKERDLFR